ncbi:MAG: acyl-CoA dehydrogenase family protein [Actinomycetota bacterium]
MDFQASDRARALEETLLDFMDRHVYPAEAVFAEQIAASGDPHFFPPVMEELKAEARRRGLWNLFLPHKTQWTEGLANIDYAPLAEITGRSFIAPQALNCNAPDTGNMELLSMFATEEQAQRWLHPLLEGEIRSAFVMTEPEVASSDATNISLSITRDGDEYVLNGRKWWTTNIADRRCAIAIVLGRTNPDAPRHQQHSMVLVPTDTPGFSVIRTLTVFGYEDQEGHGELVFDNVRVPVSNRLGEEGAGFAMAQARLGPGRIHHCMRAIGAAERALELMCRRVQHRVAFGKPLAEQGVIQEWIADSRIEIEQVRLLTLKTAWLIDTVGARAARTEIAAIKVAVLSAALRVIDRAIQAHGAGGVSGDFPLARMYAAIRALRFADGPDEVHRVTVARRELAKFRVEP